MNTNATDLAGTTSKPKSHDAQTGLAYALAAYLWWGFMPVYFHQVQHLSSLLVLAHRVVWSFVLLAVVVTFRSRWDELRRILRDGRTLAMLASSTVLLACNWGVFIYAVQIDHVVHASLGYFIVPLVSAALGVMVLRERLRTGQWIAVALAAAGVIVLTLMLGRLPWIALVITFSWSGYSLLRKLAPVAPLVGVTIETALLFPAATIYALWCIYGQGLRSQTTHDYAFLMLAGVVTSVPLICFTAAARRMRLSTIGFLQYVTPTVQFLIAVIAYNEPFTRSHAAGFALIWAALLLFSVDGLRAFQATTPAITEI
jgi:chloramphenicol-sensitive protein RarD